MAELKITLSESLSLLPKISREYRLERKETLTLSEEWDWYPVPLLMRVIVRILSKKINILS